MKIKKIISFIALTFCFCLIIGAGYTVARYAGVFDAGSFFLSLGIGTIDPGEAYTLYYHTFDENHSDYVCKTETVYENIPFEIDGVPDAPNGANSGLTFLGWTPQGMWISDENSYFSGNLDYEQDPAFIKYKRILKQSGDSVSVADLKPNTTTKEIHLYDLYEEYYVLPKCDNVHQYHQYQISSQDSSGTVLFSRDYRAEQSKTSDTTVFLRIDLNERNIKHYMHPGITYEIGSTYYHDPGGDYYYSTDIYDATGTTDITTSGNTITLVFTDTIEYTLKGTTTKRSCLAPGTLITMADGTQKEIQHVTYDDKLLVWDSFEGKYVVVPAALIVNHGFGEYTVIEMNFDDGTTVKAIGAHAFLDVDTNAWELINANNVQDYLGHSFVRTDGDGYTTVKLIDCKVYEEYTESYTIVSAGHYNFIAENMFSLTNAFHPFVGGLAFGADWTYDAEMLRQDIETYGLYTYDDFREYITEEQFVAFGGELLKISVEKGYLTFESILRLIEEYLYE